MSPEEREEVAELVAEAAMALNLALASHRRLQAFLLADKVAEEAEGLTGPPGPAQAKRGPYRASEVFKAPPDERPPVPRGPSLPSHAEESLRQAVQRAMEVGPQGADLTFGSGADDDEEDDQESS